MSSKLERNCFCVTCEQWMSLKFWPKHQRGKKHGVKSSSKFSCQTPEKQEEYDINEHSTLKKHKPIFVPRHIKWRGIMLSLCPAGGWRPQV